MIECEDVLEKFALTLNQLRHNKELTDITLICKDGEFSAHKTILAASSPFFRHLFTSVVEKKKYIQMSGIESDTLTVLLDYIYTGNLNIPETMDKVEQLLFASNQLQIPDFTRHAELELSARINPQNYGILWSIADQYGAGYLQKQVEYFIAYTLDELWFSRDFLNLDGRCLLRVFEQAALSGIAPEVVTVAAMSWLRHNPRSRHLDIIAIIPYLRLDQLHCSLLHQLWEREPLVHQVHSLTHELRKAIKTQCLGIQSAEPCEFSSYFPEAVNLPSPRSSTLKCVSENTVRVPSPKLKEPKQVHTLSPMRARSCTEKAVFSPGSLQTYKQKMIEKQQQTKNTGILVIVGHKWNNDVLVRALDFEHSVWLPPPPINPKELFGNIEVNLLSHSATATQGGSLFLIGGRDSKKVATDQFIQYDVLLAVVITLPHLLTSRSNCGADVLDDSIFVAGGLDANGKPLGLVEQYDFEKKSWKYVECLPEPCWDMGLATCKNRLYAVGGRRKNEWSSMCLAYSPVCNQWQYITLMPKEFLDTYPLLGSYDQSIMAVGHHNPQHKAHLCSFDPYTRRWGLIDTVRVKSKKILALLPWKEKMWVVDCIGTVYNYDLINRNWDIISNCGKVIPIPLYAKILTTNDNHHCFCEHH
uniref:Kelch-like protein diablo n=1 Tax=Strigamia maritima TaxID=126957 RepID=T1IIM2_STRMM